MKKTSPAVVIAALILMFTAVVNAQVSGAKVIKIDVPFDFTLSDTNFHAGHYEVSVAWEGVIWVRGPNDSVKAINSQSVSTGHSAEKTKLVFRHSGDHYFLAQVWMRGDGAGREFRPTREEQEIVSRLKPQTIEVLARK